MATIQRKNTRSGVKYTAIVRKKGHKAVSKTFKLKSHAQQWAARIENNLDELKALGNKNNNLTAAQVIDDFLEQYSKRDTCILSRLKWWRTQVGCLPFIELDESVVREQLNALSRKVTDRGTLYTNGTVNAYKNNLASIFEFAREEYGFTHNPCRNIKAKPLDNARTRFLSDSERINLLEACRVSHWERLCLLVLMALTTGARQGELLNLKWSDIDFEKRLAHVRTSKNGEQRMLPLVNSAINELLKFRAVGNHLIFPSTISPRKPYTMRKQWNNAVKKAGLTDFRFHDLRHTTASYLAQSGKSLLQIGEILGHKSPAMTYRYSHLCTDEKANTINEVFGNIQDKV